MTTTSTHLPAYDLSAIQDGLRTAAIGRTIHYQDAVDSTNDVAIALAQKGAGHGTVVLADAQSAGRGRRGRRWHSPPGLNVYCSVVLRLSRRHNRYLTVIPLASALAVADAIAETAGLQCRMKWPNDVLLGEKKVAGILCESAGGADAPLVVVGIGINANGRSDDFPADLASAVATLSAERNVPVDRAALVSTLMNRLEDRMELLTSRTLPELLAAYRSSCATLGQYVRAQLSETEVVEGLAESVDADGSLHIRLTHGADAEKTSARVIVRTADIVHVRRMTDRDSFE
jgi:BirA family biotin operon repressor/biotin-[acetyl-CoA-carboxylase] ligase